MKIYVACLASYNNGRLHGEWIDATSDADEMGVEVARILRTSPYPNVVRQDFKCEGCDETRTITLSGLPQAAKCPECGEYMVKAGEPYRSAEEWAIHDYDGVPSSFGEYPGLAMIAEYVEFVEACDDLDEDAVQAV